MSKEKMSVADLARVAEEYQNLKSLIDKYTTRQNSLKKELSDQVDSYGHADEKGSLWLPIGTHQLKRERRVGVSLDMGKAEEWAKESGLWDKVSRTVEVLDEDKLLSLAWENPELKSQVDALYATRETWAFKILESKYYGDE